VAIGLLAVCLLNTPARITWYAERIPWLAFLKGNESVMLEYGYRYEDSDIGIFRSRLSYSQLEQSDRERGEEAAAILDRYRDPLTYPRFLETYTPVSDPFVHEARVHLYRRDYYFSKATENKDDPEKFARLLTIAYRENQILEKYFSNTLHRSTYRWPKDNVALAGGHLLKREVYDSRVSWNLVTRVSEGQVACFFAIVIIGLVVLHGYIGRNENARYLF
jgi:hypothetical protein